MLRTVYVRKLYVKRYLKDVREMKHSKLRHDIMCNSYVLVCGNIEYMIESIIRGWLQHNIKKHKYKYPQKKNVDNVINALYSNAELNLYNNHTIDYERICNLLKNLAGEQTAQSFKDRVRTASPAGASETIEALKRVSLFRHLLAHGANTAAELSPNISELEKDFNTIYANLIENLNDLLVRK